MKRRPLDMTAGVLFAAIAAAIIGAGYLLASLHVINIWEAVGVLAVGTVLVAAAVPRRSTSGPRNNFAQGSSRPASPTEIQAAAQGKHAQQQAHKQQFKD